MPIKKHIPNFITIINLLCGCIAIVVAFDGMLVLSAYLIVLAAFFDYFDGMMARLLRTFSDIGKQLDSLADVISFGLAPGVIIYNLMLHNPQTPEVLIKNANIIPFISFLIPVFSALRLAKFNTYPEQTNFFIGLPTPANALLIASLPLIIASAESVKEFPFMEFSRIIHLPYFLIIMSVVLSYLLISRIKLFSLKFKNLELKNNSNRYIFLIISLFLLIAVQCAAIPTIILLYIILSLPLNLVKKPSGNNPVTE